MMGLTTRSTVPSDASTMARLRGKWPKAARFSCRDVVSMRRRAKWFSRNEKIRNSSEVEGGGQGNAWGRSDSHEFGTRVLSHTLDYVKMPHPSFIRPIILSPHLQRCTFQGYLPRYLLTYRMHGSFHPAPDTAVGIRRSGLSVGLPRLRKWAFVFFTRAPHVRPSPRYLQASSYDEGNLTRRATVGSNLGLDCAGLYAVREEL
jgi:hypothetical protein